MPWSLCGALVSLPMSKESKTSSHVQRDTEARGASWGNSSPVLGRLEHFCAGFQTGSSVNMWVVVTEGWVSPESVCTPGQGWVVLSRRARSGAKGALPSQPVSAGMVYLGLHLLSGSWALSAGRHHWRDCWVWTLGS